MPNIDTSTIQGFETMTAEERVEALLKLDIPERVDLSGYVPKATADKYASEAANYKKQLSEKMTDDEKASKEAAEAHQKLQEDYNTLLKKSTISEHTAKFLAIGYDEKLARDTAEALFSGDMERVFANQQTFNASREKALRAEIMKGTPQPNGAGDGNDHQKQDVNLGEALGKQKAESMKSTADGLKKFMV